MRRIREIIEKHHIHGLSQTETSRSAGVSRGSVQNYLERLAQSGLEPAAALALSDLELESRLFPEPTEKPIQSTESRPLPDWDRVSSEFLRKGVTRKLLWQEYSQNKTVAIRYSRFCALLEEHQGRSQLVMRHGHKGGALINTLNRTTHAFELLDKCSNPLKHRLLFGEELRVQAAHFGKYVIEFGSILASKLPL